MNALSRAIRILGVVDSFSRWTNKISAGVVFVMVGLTFIDVFLRYIFNRPIRGALEMAEVMLIIAVFFSIAHTYDQKGHVNVDIISSMLSAKTQLMLEFITTLISACLLAIIVRCEFIQTLIFYKSSAVHSAYFKIPSSPFSAVIVIGCTFLFLMIVKNLLLQTLEVKSLGLPLKNWVFMIGISLLFIILSVIWMHPDFWHFSKPVIGVLGLIFSLILILSGMPIAFALFITGILFIGHIRGVGTAFSMLGRDIYRNSGEYVWGAIAFFVLMGYFCLNSRFGEDLYAMFNRWIGRLRGGLAMATSASCTGFAAIVGDTISSIATMTAVAMPEMKKYSYDDRLSTGSIAGGSIIGPIIPPSIPFIIYGVLTKVSIGKLFIAGIIPGILLGVAFIVTINIWCRINPLLGPPGEKATWGERLISLKASGPIVCLFALVIGGIYGGAFSPCEGGAIGATGALIIGIIMRRFTWKRLFRSLIDTVKVLSMVILIVNGAMIFTRFVAWCNISDRVVESFSKLGLSSDGTVFIIILLFFILGFVVDIMTLTVIGVPILHPVAVAQGADPLWFATLVVLVMTLGALTPPIGINLFTMKGMAKDIPMSTIYKGAMPFVASAVIVIIIVFFVPSIVTWLPYLLQ